MPKRKQRTPGRIYETPLTADILRMLNLIKGCEFRKQNTGAGQIGTGSKSRFVRFGEAGQADITGTLPGGRRIEIEVKTPQRFRLKDRGRSSAQEKFRVRMTKIGAVYLTVCEVDQTYKKVLQLAQKEEENQWILRGENESSTG